MTTEADDMLLPGAKPQKQLAVRIRPEYIAERAMDHLKAILDILQADAEVTQEIRNDIVFLNVASKTAASILIGKDGQTLDALQYLLTRMALRVGREAPMIVVDVEDYRRRQFDKLEQLAQRAAARARKTGFEIELDPMSAIERKYLHNYLRTMENIRTFSRGEEPERFLVIIAD